MQLPLLTPESNWRPPQLSSLPSWAGAGRVALDTETCDPQLRELGPGVRRGAYITGYSFSIEDGPSHYVPMRHQGGDNVESPEAAIAYLNHQLKGFTGEIVGAHIGYDMDFLLEAGVEFPQVKKFRDVQVAEALIDELLPGYSLEAISQRWLGVGKSEALLREAAACYHIDPKKEMWKLPARYVGEYATADAALPLRILRRQERELDSQELWNVYNLESELLPVLIRMRRRGIRIDRQRLEEVEKWSVAQERLALKEVEQLTGFRIPLNSVWTTDSLVPALVHIGVKIPLTPKTKKPSIDKDFLAGIDHPVARALQRARQVNKVRTTFVSSIQEHMVNGRVHCSYNQMRGSSDADGDEDSQGAAYGRLSSVDPNLQQQPARHPEIGPMWRSIYIPDEGGEFCSADYSQQEPKMLVHYAVRSKLGLVRVRTSDGWLQVDADAAALTAANMYRNDPSTDNHQMMGDMIMGRKATKQERGWAKEIYLGLSYGMGGAKLCRKLGLPTMMAVRDPVSKAIVEAASPTGRQIAGAGGKIFEAAGIEGQRLLDMFDAKVPFVRALGKLCERAASKNGYIRTIEGRKCRFPKDTVGNYDWCHKALNRLIQGSSADQTKRAMVEIDRAGIALQLQVHDEIDLTIYDRGEGERMRQIMLDCVKLEVPSKVDLEIGPSWGEVK